MDQYKRCEEIIERHYAEILRYCLYLLNSDMCGAEDCTQDVFLLLLQKQDKLDFDDNIRGWLYITAYQTVKNYIRKQAHSYTIPFQDMEQFKREAAVPNDMFSSSAYEDLTDEDLQLLTDYYSAKHGDRKTIAEKYGMTVRQLYKQVHILREKIKQKYIGK